MLQSCIHQTPLKPVEIGCWDYRDADSWSYYSKVHGKFLREQQAVQAINTPDKQSSNGEISHFPPIKGGYCKPKLLKQRNVHCLEGKQIPKVLKGAPLKSQISVRINSRGTALKRL